MRYIIIESCHVTCRASSRGDFGSWFTDLSTRPPAETPRAKTETKVRERLSQVDALLKRAKLASIQTRRLPAAPRRLPGGSPAAPRRLPGGSPAAPRRGLSRILPGVSDKRPVGAFFSAQNVRYQNLNLAQRPAERRPDARHRTRASRATCASCRRPCRRACSGRCPCCASCPTCRAWPSCCSRSAAAGGPSPSSCSSGPTAAGPC